MRLSHWAGGIEGGGKERSAETKGSPSRLLLEREGLPP